MAALRADFRVLSKQDRRGLEEFTYFSYGLDLNLALLHSIVGGKRPESDGYAYLEGYKLSFTCNGHLPNIEKCSSGIVSGALTRITREQQERLEAAWLVPALYRPVRVVARCSRGIRCRLPAYVAAEPQPQREPSLSVWREMVAGARERGFPDDMIQKLIQFRINDAHLVRHAS